MFWVAGRLQQHRWQVFMLSMLSIDRGNRIDSVGEWKREKKWTAAKDSKFLDLA